MKKLVASLTLAIAAFGMVGGTASVADAKATPPAYKASFMDAAITKAFNARLATLQISARITKTLCDRNYDPSWTCYAHGNDGELISMQVKITNGGYGWHVTSSQNV